MVSNQLDEHVIKSLLQDQSAPIDSFGTVSYTHLYEKTFATAQHDHMIDTVSGKIVEFYDPRIQEIIEDACLKNNFRHSHHTLYIYGETLDSK